MGRAEPFISASLDLNKREHGAIIGYQVDLPEWGSIVAGHNPIAGTPKIACRFRFAVPSKSLSVI